MGLQKLNKPLFLPKISAFKNATQSAYTQQWVHFPCFVCLESHKKIIIFVVVMAINTSFGIFLF